MEERDCRDKESPNDHLPSTGSISRKALAQEIHANAEGDWDNEIKAIEKAQFRKAGQIAHGFKVRGKVFARRDPQHVAPDKAVLMGRVRVTRLVGVAVMMPVVGGPPERAALECAIAYQGKDELRSPRSRKGAMREVFLFPFLCSLARFD